MSLQSRIEKAPIEAISVSRIEIGDRRRKKRSVLHDLKVLTSSIEDLGLIHPVLVTPDGEANGYRLVCGERRLTAFRDRLGKKSIPARVIEGLSEEELRALELDENEARSDLDAFEASSSRIEEIEFLEQAAIDAEMEANAKSREPKRGKALEKALDAAKRKARHPSVSGIPSSTHGDDRQIVSIVNRYPFMSAWSKRQILNTAEGLNGLGTSEINKVVPVLQLLHKKKDLQQAPAVVENLSHIDPEVYKVIVERAKSDDPDQQSRAISDALRVPPVNDPRLAHIKEAIRELKEAIKYGKSKAKTRGDAAQHDLIDAKKSAERAYELLMSAYDKELKDFHSSIKERVA